MKRSANFNAIAQQLMTVGQQCAQYDLTPATSGNFSHKIDAEHIAITASGKDKGQLTPDDIILLDLHGNALDAKAKPSAETLLHLALYQHFNAINSVIHTHGLAATILSKLYKPNQEIILDNYELLKVFSKDTKHDTNVHVPVFANQEFVGLLSQEIVEYLSYQKTIFGFLISGHGLYTWGKSLTEAFRFTETFNYLFQCELELRKHLK